MQYSFFNHSSPVKKKLFLILKITLGGFSCIMLNFEAYLQKLNTSAGNFHSFLLNKTHFTAFSIYFFVKCTLDSALRHCLVLQLDYTTHSLGLLKFIASNFLQSSKAASQNFIGMILSR